MLLIWRKYAGRSGRNSWAETFFTQFLPPACVLTPPLKDQSIMLTFPCFSYTSKKTPWWKLHYSENASCKPNPAQTPSHLYILLGHHFLPVKRDYYTQDFCTLDFWLLLILLWPSMFSPHRQISHCTLLKPLLWILISMWARTYNKRWDP